jgi:hypothetical protein
MPVPLNLSGWGTISIDGALAAPAKMDSTTTIRIHDFKGSISLMNMIVQGAFTPEGQLPGLRLLAWNVQFYHKMNALGFLRPGLAYQAAFLGLNAQCFDARNENCKTIISIPDKVINTSDTTAFADEMTRLTRKSKPVPFRELSPGVSNVYISRMSIGAMGKGIIFSP